MGKLSTLLALVLLGAGPAAMAQAPVITAQAPAANAVAAPRNSAQTKRLPPSFAGLSVDTALPAAK